MDETDTQASVEEIEELEPEVEGEPLEIEDSSDDSELDPSIAPQIDDS